MFDLLVNGENKTIQLSNGILFHNKVDLDVLGLSSYKKYFNKPELQNLIISQRSQNENEVNSSDRQPLNFQFLAGGQSRVIEGEAFKHDDVENEDSQPQDLFQIIKAISIAIVNATMN